MLHTAPELADAQEADSKSDALAWLSSFPELSAEVDDAFSVDADVLGQDESGRDVPLGQHEKETTARVSERRGSSSDEDTRGSERPEDCHTVEFSIWGRDEFFQFDTLSRTITLCINHALADYAMERWLDSKQFTRRVTSSVSQDWLLSVSGILQRSLVISQCFCLCLCWFFVNYSCLSSRNWSLRRLPKSLDRWTLYLVKNTTEQFPPRSLTDLFLLCGQRGMFIRLSTS
jgi:hypothetical protein